MSDGETVSADDMPVGRHVEIEQAKGALMVLYGITADDAFELLVSVDAQ